jgi:hypothetical protein
MKGMKIMEKTSFFRKDCAQSTPKRKPEVFSMASIPIMIFML